MRNLILLFLIFTLPFSLAAQENIGEIKGIIYDSINDYALQSASVSVFKQKDSSVVAFQLSDASGEFTIKNIPLKTPLYIAVSYTGYRLLIKNILLDSIHFLQDYKRLILFQKSENEMDEVVIKSVQPISMRGDTLVINPDAFKLDSNAVVEDMLLRVPGLMVWADGTITMNGRKMEKVYVDGKPFFGGATQTATQNLPKNAIDEIQVYQEKDLTKMQPTDEKTDSLYAMNIKLKEDKKKGMFGKVGAGYGTNERYTGDGVMQFYNKKTQIGIAAGINNINKEEGTGENAFLENTFKSNFRIFFVGLGGPEGGITRRTYVNAKLQHSFSESNNSQFYNRINGDYGYLNTSLNISSNITDVKNINDYKLSSFSENKNLNNTTSNTVKFLYENSKQYGNFVNVSGDYTNNYTTENSLSETNVLINDLNPVSKTINETKSTTSSDNFNMFGFTRSNSANQLQDPRKNYSLFFQGGINNSNKIINTRSDFQSFVDSIQSDFIDRNYNNVNRSYRGSIYLNYDGFKNLLFGIYNFYNIEISLTNSININRNEQNSMVTDFDTLTNTYLQNILLTNQNTSTDVNYSSGLRLNKSINKSVWGKYNYWLNLGFELSYQFMNKKNESNFLFRNVDRNFNSLMPSFNVNFNYDKDNAYRISSNIWSYIYLQPPTIDDLYPLVDSTNRYSLTVGNPNLKTPNRKYANWRFDINRNKLNTKSTYGVNINFNYENVADAISDNTVYDSAGRSTRYLLNVSNQSNLSGNFEARFSTNFTKLSSLGFSYKTNYSTNSRPGFINYVSSTSKNNTISNNLTATYSLIDKFNISVGETIADNRSQQKGINAISSAIRNYTTTSNLNYFITKSFTLNTSIDHQRNIAANGNAISANIWNANATYRFMQQKAELKFSAFDLLRQNKNIQNFVQQNSASTRITNGLQQYFMLTFSFYPRKFGNSNKQLSSPGIIIAR